MKTKKQRIKEIKKEIKVYKQLYNAIIFKSSYPGEEYLTFLEEKIVKLKQKLKGIKLGIW